MKTSGRKIYLAWGARVAPGCELFHPFHFVQINGAFVKP